MRRRRAQASPQSTIATEPHSAVVENADRLEDTTDDDLRVRIAREVSADLYLRRLPMETVFEVEFARRYHAARAGVPVERPRDPGASRAHEMQTVEEADRRREDLRRQAEQIEESNG